MNTFNDNSLTPPVTPPLKNPLIGFRIHGLVFFATIGLLLLFDAATGDSKWVQYVFMGWGIGLFAHGMAAALKWRAQRRGRLD
jgi:hypothetical protein